jgi:hypothetical protein
MFPRSGVLSARHSHAGVVLAAATFAGLGVGATIGPVTSSRNGSEVSAPALAETARSFETNRVVHPAEVLRGIDAPELKARCGEERVKAEAAREALRTILDQGEVSIFRVTLDKYGGVSSPTQRTRATPNVSSALLSVGAARRYSGGHRDGWCP